MKNCEVKEILALIGLSKKILIALFFVLILAIGFFLVKDSKSEEIPKLGVIKPLTDYKFWYITRDNGFIIEAAVYFNEGQMVDIFRNGATTTIYRRFKNLTKADLPYLPDKFRRNANGRLAAIYTPAEFGSIKTDDELRLFLNGELAKDPNRIPIPEQTGNTLR